MTLALVLEYEASAAIALSEALKTSGYAVTVAHQREDIAAALTLRPDAVVLGRLADPPEAAQACRMVRGVIDKEVPILVLGRSNTAGERDDAMAAGASDYLLSPVSEPTLIARLRRRIRDLNRGRWQPSSLAATW
jgi:DNA-binding response OmpR family regulator